MNLQMWLEMIKKEFTYFFTALMFFTRIPIPFRLTYSEEIMNQSQRYYPLVGWIVGGLTGLVFYLSQLLFSLEIALLLSITFSVLLTGAFHEDGFTDSCDAFGGGYGKEKIMTIMKDSRIGAYGTIGIMLLLLLKFFSLLELSGYSLNFCIAALINGHTTSRFHSATMIYTHDYVSDTDRSKSKPMAQNRLSYGSLLFSLVCTLVPYALFQNPLFLVAFPISYIGKLVLARYFYKHIGGYTGDCLGAIQQVCEVLFYLSLIFLWKYT